MSEPAPGPAQDPRGAAGGMGARRRTAERLVALLITGAVALNFPVLAIFRGRGLWAGIPVLYAYLFLAWLLLAAGTAIVLRRRAARPRGPAGGAGPDEP